MSYERFRSSQARLVLVLSVGFAAACATSSGPPRQFDFHVESSPGAQAWYEKVEAWQERSRNDGDAGALRADLVGAEIAGEKVEPGVDPPLAFKIASFARSEQREVARRINAWSQRQAIWHYKKEETETFADDTWPSYRQLVDADGDDCDGLDLISFQLLGSFGFDPDMVYRAVMRRDSDRVNHMVTLWFETPDDPWVLDATRAITTEMIKMSEVRGWTPTVMFNRERQFTVLEAQLQAHRGAGPSHD